LGIENYKTGKECDMGLGNRNKQFFDVLVFIVLALGAFSSAVAEVEFPGPAPGKSPWKEDAGSEAIVLSAGKTHTFELKPFEALVFDATPL
jgi:hypothetical protein